MNGEFAPNGKCHRILRRLRDSAADMVALAELVGGPNQSRSAARSRAYNLLAALRSQGLIHSSAGLHYITAAGGDALTALDYGQPFRLNPSRPQVRIFEGATS